MARARPYLWPTVFAIPAFAVLVALGVWQLDRRAWKHELIERAAERPAMAAVELPSRESWSALDLDDWEYRPVEARGVFDHDAEALVYTFLTEPRGANGGAGYLVMTPFRLDSGGAVIVNRGFVPDASKDRAARSADPLPQGSIMISGLLRKPEVPGWFVPEGDARANLWFARDIGAIAAARGLDDVAPFSIDVGAGERGLLPQGGETRLGFRDSHLGYALTWFGLAAGLFVVYLAFLRSRGRKVT